MSKRVLRISGLPGTGKSWLADKIVGNLPSSMGSVCYIPEQVGLVLRNDAHASLRHKDVLDSFPSVDHTKGYNFQLCDSLAAKYYPSAGVLEWLLRIYDFVVWDGASYVRALYGGTNPSAAVATDELLHSPHAHLIQDIVLLGEVSKDALEDPTRPEATAGESMREAYLQASFLITGSKVYKDSRELVASEKITKLNHFQTYFEKIMEIQ